MDWLGALTSAAYEDLALELSMMTTGTGKFLPARVDSAGVTTVQLRELEQAKQSLDDPTREPPEPIVAPMVPSASDEADEANPAMEHIRQAEAEMDQQQ